MKTTNNLTTGYLKEEYYQTLADYFFKFIESYEKNKVPIWGITTTNEPLNGIYVPGAGNRLQWTVGDMGKWIENNLDPTIRNSTFKHVKIIAMDDQRNLIPVWFNTLISTYPGALEYIDGVGVHHYFDEYSPATQLTKPLEDYPDKFILYTESAEGTTASADLKVDLGSWSRGEHYGLNIMENLNHKVIGWLDWNMCLDETGGPTWIDNFIDSPIIVSSDKQEFYKQPMFYAIGHFSKFIPRGSRRIKIEEASCSISVSSVAFLTPQNTVVVVMVNQRVNLKGGVISRSDKYLQKYGDKHLIYRGNQTSVQVKLGEESAVVSVEAKSFTTIELPLTNENTNQIR